MVDAPPEALVVDVPPEVVAVVPEPEAAVVVVVLVDDELEQAASPSEPPTT